MSQSPGQTLARISEQSARYAAAATALSCSIVEMEEFLGSLPGKVAVSYTQPNLAIDASLEYARSSDGRWYIYVGQGLGGALAALVSKTPTPQATPLRDASVDTKIRVAPMLPGLLEKICAELGARADSAASAVEDVSQTLARLKRGGV